MTQIYDFILFYVPILSQRLRKCGDKVKSFISFYVSILSQRLCKCGDEVKKHYAENTNVLKIPLVPSTTSKIHSVETLYVSEKLVWCKISPDLPIKEPISTEDLFREGDGRKKRKLLLGVSGAGKTTEIKMWLHKWCQKQPSGPLTRFTLVFYVDLLTLGPNSSLGKAISGRCLPMNSRMSPKEAEEMCRKHHNEILVILDNYDKARENFKPTEIEAFVNIVQLKDFQELNIVVVSSRDRFGDFKEVLACYDHIEASGVEQTSVKDYILRVFSKRKEFGEDLQKYLEDHNLVEDVAAAPVLLTSLCQIVKWGKKPTDLGDLKTTSKLVNKFMDCYIKHSEDVELSRKMEAHNISSNQPSDGISEQPVGQTGITGEDARQISSGQPLAGSHQGIPFPLKSQFSQAENKLPAETTIRYLQAVAFGCYFNDGSRERLQLSEDDFEICGGMRDQVIAEGCKLGLLTQPCLEEVYPTSPEAVEGKIITFQMPQFQQKLAADHLTNFLRGSEEEKASFETSLQKIRSIDDVLAVENLLKYACGVSLDAARDIVSQVVQLVDQEKGPDLPANRAGSFVAQAHGRQQRLSELVMEMNYEAQSNGQLNDIIRPVMSRMRLVSPSSIAQRSLTYILEHTVPEDAPHLQGVHVELLGASEMPDVSRKLESIKNIKVRYNPDALVEMEGQFHGAESGAGPESKKMNKLTIETDEVQCSSDALQGLEFLQAEQSLPKLGAACADSAAVSGSNMTIDTTAIKKREFLKIMF